MTPLRRFWLPVAWMAAIFVFSTSLFSSRETGSVLEAIVRLVYPAASDAFLVTAHFIARKSAHMAEYALLAYLWMRSLTAGGGWQPQKPALVTLVICVAYAATDEFHQSFVPERYASPLDVLIDSSGAAFALLLMRAKKKRTLPCAP